MRPAAEVTHLFRPTPAFVLGPVVPVLTAAWLAGTALLVVVQVFVMTAGYMLSDVMADALVVERQASKQAPPLLLLLYPHPPHRCSSLTGLRWWLADRFSAPSACTGVCRAGLRSKLEPGLSVGTMQATSYILRYFGNIIGSVFGMFAG